MKRLYLISLFALAWALVAASCGRDGITNNPVDPTKDGIGYLSFANWQLTVNEDHETQQGGKDVEQKNTRADEPTVTEASDTYIVRICDLDGVLIDGHNYTYAQIKALEEGKIALQPGSYKVVVTSANHAEIPDTAWEHTDPALHPAAYSGEMEISVVKNQTTAVEHLTCRLANIKTSVTVAADMAAMFDDNSTNPLTTTLSIGENAIAFEHPEERAAYFKAVEATNTLHVVVTGDYNIAAGDETPDYQPVEFEQNITNAKAGQWHKIDVRVKNINDGNVQFEIVVETWVYDELIDVDVMENIYALGEEEIDDELISDENSPVFTLKGGHDITAPFLVNDGIFDFDLSQCSDMIHAEFTPVGGASISSLKAVFDSNNAAFLAAMAAAGHADYTFDLAPAADPSIASYCLVDMDGQSQRVRTTYAGMKALYDFEGIHTVTFTAVDSQNRTSHNTLTITVSHSTPAAEGLNIAWYDNDSYTGTTFDMDVRHTLPAPDGALPVYIKITSETGLTGLTVDIVSTALDAATLETLDLANHMDLVNPASEAMNNGLSGLGFPTRDNVSGQTEVTFDISSFMPMLYGVAKGDSPDFVLTATDASGTVVKKIMLYVPTL